MTTEEEKKTTGVTVTSRGANRDNPDPQQPFTEKGPLQATQIIPKPTERVRRRTAQAENLRAARVQDANQRGPTKAERSELEAAKVAAALLAPTTDRRSVRQASQDRHKAQAKLEAVTLAAVITDPILVDVIPGEQPTLLQLRRLSKQNQKQVRDEATDIGKAAGKVVRDMLIGRTIRQTPHRRDAKVAAQQDAMQKAQANAIK